MRFIYTEKFGLLTYCFNDWTGAVYLKNMEGDVMAVGTSVDSVRNEILSY